MSQLTDIKTHLTKGNSLTAMDALEQYDCFRLSARINDLRNEGMNIKTYIMQINNKRIAKYIIE